jgi:tetratricopeptide (TPR) repeat protein
VNETVVQEMKNPITIICVLVIALTSACKKENDSANTSGGFSIVQNVEGGRDARHVENVSARFESANAFFKKGDIHAALTDLDFALVNDPKNPGILNLRGSCYVELRDFKKALEAFTEASNGDPHNPSILFNIGEVHWAIVAFEESKNLMKPEQTPLRDLIEFKILLCHAALGNKEAFARLAANIPSGDDTLRTFFTKAVVEYHSNNEAQAEKILVDAERAFPDKKQRAVWEDTMEEFFYGQ